MSEMSEFIETMDELVKEGSVSWGEALKMFRSEYGLGLRECMTIAKKWQSMQEKTKLQMESSQ